LSPILSIPKNRKLGDVYATDYDGASTPSNVLDKDEKAELGTCQAV